MMDKKQFAQFVMALKTYFSKEEKLLPNQQAIELWYQELQDIPFDVAQASLRKWVSTNKWSPSIAEIREIACEITKGDVPEWADAWKLVIDAVRKYGLYEGQQALQMIEDGNKIAYDCVKIIGFRNLCLSEKIEFERNTFKEIYNSYAAREKKNLVIPNDLRLLESEQRKHYMIEG